MAIREPRRVRWWGALLLVCLLALGARGADDAVCTCERKGACYHYLRAPVTPPDYPCACRRCEESAERHDGGRVPGGFHSACFASKDMDCFLRRHAASWKLICSECLATDDCCKFENQERCPACGPLKRPDPFDRDAFNKPARASVAAQLELEKEVFGKRAPIVVYSRHFYLVTDIPKMKVRLQDSAKFRFASGHEYAHLMIEWAERGLRDFKRAFPGTVSLRRPMGIFVPEKEKTAFAIQKRYFRAERTHMIYASMGGSAESTIADGFCRNGFCVSAERVRGSASAKELKGSQDYALHHSIRHLVANIAFTCWIRIQGDVRTTPRWVFEGVGHWLGRRPEKLRKDVYYCVGETKKQRGSSEEWMEKLEEWAAKGELRPIEEIFGKDSLGKLDYLDHVQSWGYFELCMAEWRRPFVAMLKDLRKEVPLRESFQKNLDCTPEEFHRRFVERLRGKRASMDPAAADGEPPAVPEAPADRFDPAWVPDVLAARVRSLGAIEDAATARELVDLLGATESDLVRQTIVTELSKSRSPAVHEVLFTAGLRHAKPVARAFSARLCRLMKIRAAREGLRATHDDSFWLARAEAALASATIEDFEAQAKVRGMLKDRSAKVRVAAMDALALYGEKVNRQCVPLVCGNLDHRDWQVRVAACQVLAQIGDHQAISPLIERIEVERGRVLEALLDALRKITGDDLGVKPAHWREWWKREKPNVLQRGGFITPSKPPKDPEKPSRYAKEPYYGVEIFSERIAYVLDVSRSTHRSFQPDRPTAERLLGDYSGETPTINGICREEIARSLAALDPRVHFTVITFNSAVKVWKHPLVRAHAAACKDAVGFLRTQEPWDDTNFHGALSVALGNEHIGDLEPDYRDAPDTITFLTDGSPTAGEITGVEPLLAWSAERNRYARARLHVIAFGSLGVKERFLGRLAQLFDGTFVQLREVTTR